MPMRRGRNYTPDLENLEVQLLLEGITRHYGFDFSDFASAPLRRRIWEAIRREKVRTVSGLQEKLLHDYSVMERFLFSVSASANIYSARFLLAFREQVVPLLRTYPFIRIWHAGCASTKDLYSLAILFTEEGLQEKTTIYATDVNETNLSRLHEAAFPLAVFDEYKVHYRNSGGKGRLEDYCSVSQKHMVYKADLRANIVFAQHNLATDGSFNEFNAILCRNILSSLTAPLQARAHAVLYESLGMFGVLGLGPHETIVSTPREACYAEVDAEHRLYRKIR
jgi:chemotaxis protein methyltransferase CheR